jgi:hypothetical protein
LLELIVIFETSFQESLLEETIFKLKSTFELSPDFINTFLVKLSSSHKLELIETLKLSSFPVLL